jgi:hypothetical protein
MPRETGKSLALSALCENDPGFAGNRIPEFLAILSYSRLLIGCSESVIFPSPCQNDAPIRLRFGNIVSVPFRQFWIHAKSLVVFEECSGRASAHISYFSAFLRVSQMATRGQNSQQEVSFILKWRRDARTVLVRTAAVIEGSFGQAEVKATCWPVFLISYQSRECFKVSKMKDGVSLAPTALAGIVDRRLRRDRPWPQLSAGVTLLCCCWRGEVPMRRSL